MFCNCFLLVYIKTCTLYFADGSHCYLHLYTIFFCETFLYTQKAKKTNPFYVRFKKIPNTESSLEQQKWKFYFWIIQQLNNHKNASQFTKQLWKKNLIYLVQDTIKWLNCVMYYLNMKMKEKLVEIIDLKLCSSLK